MKSFKILLILLVFLLYAPFASSKEIPVNEARKIAQTFFDKHITKSSGSVDLQMIWDGDISYVRSVSDAPAFYVFDNAAGTGFIIVAGDEAAKPILGYSFENEFIIDNMPPNIRSWFQGIEEAVLQARRNPSSYKASEPYVGNVVLKMETAKWDQDHPYNKFCPKDGFKLSVTGCVATAVAILMRYHQWPERGVGTIPAYETESKGINVPAIELGYEYDWDNMPLVYSPGYTARQEDAVARLMADCGAMLKMDYSSIGSGAHTEDISKAMYEFMNYDGSIGAYTRSVYTDEQWHSMVQKELIENGPVIYTGHDGSFGHAFILDGFTDAEYYSLNWGWSGYCDGYFTLDALNPTGQGIGGGEGVYNQGQMAVLNVKKEQGGIPEIRGHIYEYNGYAGLKADRDVFEPRVPFRLSTGLMLNNGIHQFNGYMGFIIVDADGRFKEPVYVFKAELPSGYGYQFIDQSLTFVSDLNFGDKLIAAMYDARNERWVKMLAEKTDGASDAIPLCDEYSIAESTSFEYNTATRIITLTVKDGVCAYVTAEDGSTVDDVVHHAEGYITIDTSSLKEGRYGLYLYKGKEEVELLFTVGSR